MWRTTVSARAPLRSRARVRVRRPAGVAGRGLHVADPGGRHGGLHDCQRPRRRPIRAMAGTPGRTCTCRRRWSGAPSARRQHARPGLGQTGPVREVNFPRPTHQQGGVEGGAPIPGGHARGARAAAWPRGLGQGGDRPGHGSFKVRGRLAAVSATLEQDPGRAVVASSAGDSGLGFAYAASELAPPESWCPRARRRPRCCHSNSSTCASSCTARATARPSQYALELADRTGAATSRPTTTPTSSAPPGRRPGRAAKRRRGPVTASVCRARGCGGLLAGTILGLEGTGVPHVGIESEASPSMSTAL